MQLVALVQDWQFVITVEHVTQVLEEVSKYWLELHEVQVAPLVPSKQRVQYEEFVQVEQLVMAELQARQV